MNEYATLRALHRPGDPLVLPNVWDAGSVKIVEEAGYPALATASASIAAMLGYPDHEGAPADEMFAAAARVIRAATVPVTVDAEAGYGLKPDGLAARLRGIGAAGCNIEDTDPATGLKDADAQAGYIAALRAADPDLVINARVDAFLAGLDDPVGEAVARGRRYLEAGADCVYPILAPFERVGELVAGIPGPVNIACFPGTTPRRLAELGVARISFGPQPYLHALETLRTFATRAAAGEDPAAG
ncbi:isocitrate lyase/phosphoenolpyruvate mutase family protein [Actinomadura kijaniata]|uniref:2-methylisocitrate lyase-like PEP mutase family enzyme n=1 Tax=Actinomadura namibiensis TaxID=182080 RepID=A0A7W3QJZ5_ACTNM|nr:isocitrate lyase/phosphoenolpyruvate mutase family protein [Actinomadura namibiensis]MBA8949842.1 2-methylisocitrate lyase-like PEP mutase family enzyme [Actinomadura namibiensis]